MKNEIIIKIDKKELLEKSEVAGKAALTLDAVQALIQILTWQKQIEEVLTKLKEEIPQIAKEYIKGSEFLGIIDPTKTLSSTYRAYGSNYVTEEYLNDAEGYQKIAPYMKQIVRYEVDADKVDQYVADHGELPEGIKKRDKAKVLSIGLKK